MTNGSEWLLPFCAYGERAWAVLVIDQAEVDRRRDAGLGPIVDRQLLRVLAQMPERVAVPWTDIDPLHAVVLDTAPAGTVESDRHYVTRIASPAVTFAMFLSDDYSIRGQRSIAWFAADAPRALVVPRTARSGDVQCDFGVGVVTWSLANGFEVVVEPTSTLVRASYRRWLTRENALKQLIESAPLVGSTP